MKDLKFEMSMDVLNTYIIIWNTQPFVEEHEIDELTKRVKLDADIEIDATIYKV